MADHLTRILLGGSLAVACLMSPCHVRGQVGLPGDSLASAVYDPASGQITVSVQNVYNWYVESLSGSLTTGDITLPAVPGGLVTNNPNRVGQSSFEAAFSYSDFALGPIAALSLPASDLFLRYSAGYGVPEVTVPVVGGLDLPPIAPGPPPAEPPFPPAEPPFPPLPGLPPSPHERPTGVPGESYAWADYNSTTGEIILTALNVQNWWIESASGSLTGVPVNLPTVEGGLVTNHDLRVGHGSLQTALSYQDMSLGSVAAPSLFEGDLVLHYSPGYGLPEVSAWVTGGLPGPPPPPLPPEPPTLPEPPAPPVVVEPPAPPVIIEPPVDPGQPTLPPDVVGPIEPPIDYERPPEHDSAPFILPIWDPEIGLIDDGVAIFGHLMPSVKILLRRYEPVPLDEFLGDFDAGALSDLTLLNWLDSSELREDLTDQFTSLVAVEIPIDGATTAYALAATQPDGNQPTDFYVIGVAAEASGLVPEPSALGLAGVGLLGALASARSRRRRKG